VDRNDWDAVAKKKKHYLPDQFLCCLKKRQFIRLIGKWDNGARDKIVLKTDLFEEAMGYDGIMDWLGRRYRKVIGMDISPAIVRNIPVNGGVTQPEYVINDVRATTFKDNYFDLIVSNSTIDHFAEIDQALRELYRILKPGGVLILTLHNRLQVAFSFMIWLKRMLVIKDFSYGYSFTLGNICRRLSKTGFMITDTTYIYFFPPLITSLAASSRGELRKALRRIILVYGAKTSQNRYLNKIYGGEAADKLRETAWKQRLGVRGAEFGTQKELLTRAETEFKKIEQDYNYGRIKIEDVKSRARVANPNDPRGFWRCNSFNSDWFSDW